MFVQIAVNSRQAFGCHRTFSLLEWFFQAVPYYRGSLNLVATSPPLFKLLTSED